MQNEQLSALVQSGAGVLIWEFIAQAVDLRFGVVQDKLQIKYVLSQSQPDRFSCSDCAAGGFEVVPVGPVRPDVPDAHPPSLSLSDFTPRESEHPAAHRAHISCVRALGMPGLPTRAVSSALPERPKAEGFCMGAQRLHAHICTYESVRDVRGFSCERVYTDPWSRPRRARRARGWLRVSVQVRSRVIYSTTYLTQTQTAPARDLPVAARISGTENVQPSVYSGHS